MYSLNWKSCNNLQSLPTAVTEVYEVLRNEFSSACVWKVSCYILRGQNFGHYFPLANCSWMEKKKFTMKKLTC